MHLVGFEPKTSPSTHS